MSYTPVVAGGYSTVYWSAYQDIKADYCTLGGSSSYSIPGFSYGTYYIWNFLGVGGIHFTPPPPYLSWITYTTINGYFYNSGQISGPTGSFTFGPVNGPVSFNLSCTNTGGWNEGSGNASITVYPTSPAPTSLNYFNASSYTIPSNTNATLNYSGNRGTYGTGLYLGGYGYLSGWSGSISRGPQASSTVYSIYTEDSYYGQVGPWSLTVAVAAPVAPPPAVSLSQSQSTTQPNADWTLFWSSSGSVTSCTMDMTKPDGTYVAPWSQTASGSTVNNNSQAGQLSFRYRCTGPGGTSADAVLYHTVAAAPTDICSDIAGTQASVPFNCVAPSPAPGSCIPANASYDDSSSSCVCKAGYARDGAGACIVHPEIAITVNGKDAVRVRRGSDVTVAWSATGVTAGTCRVTTNAGTTLGSSDSGSQSATVNNQTIYTLTCALDAGGTQSDTASVNLVPEFIEQ